MLFAVHVIRDERHTRWTTYLIGAQSKNHAATIAMQEGGEQVATRAYEVSEEVASRIDLPEGYAWKLFDGSTGAP